MATVADSISTPLANPISTPAAPPIRKRRKHRQQPVPYCLMAERLILVDQHGNTRFDLACTTSGVAELRMHDADGTVRASITVSADGAVASIATTTIDGCEAALRTIQAVDGGSYAAVEASALHGDETAAIMASEFGGATVEGGVSP